LRHSTAAVHFTHPKAGLMRDGGRIEDLWHVRNLATTSSDPGAISNDALYRDLLRDAYLRERLFTE
jgi:hypothetical protein